MLHSPPPISSIPATMLLRTATPLLPITPSFPRGNFVIYKAGASAVWSTFTGTGIPASVRVILTTTG